MSAIDNQYNRLDRVLHHFAFGLPFIQKSLSDMEDDVYASELAALRLERPLFVTGLPRGGTTLLLELLYGTNEFATTTYRQMPFILSPLLWNRLSAPFQRKAETRERSHGDGMQVSFDSPEAFEEVLWLTYLKDHILGSHALNTVPPEAVSDDFCRLFRQLARKIVLLRQQRVGSGPYRYLSKNNANISRLGALRKIFPDAIVLIPFRNPLSHAQSLMHQHSRFLNAHSADDFSRKYMEWIGHYEFGANFKPIDFDGSGGELLSINALDADFWVEYWTRAYRYILEHAGAGVHLVDFDGLLRDPSSLERIGLTAGVLNLERLTDAAKSLRKPTSRPLEASVISDAIFEAAQAVHKALQDRTLQ